MTPDWYPNWENKVAAVLATGPSIKKENLGVLRDRAKIIAIKEANKLCEFADVVYGCDAAWWNYRNGLQEFRGLKITWSGSQISFPDVKKVYIDTSQDRIRPVHRRQYRMIYEPVGTVGNGGNSGFQAVNLAIQFGARRIILVGFDMNDRGDVHYYGRNNWFGSGNPDEGRFSQWRTTFAQNVPDFEMRGIEIVNVSPVSALTCFRRGTIESTLKGWGV